MELQAVIEKRQSIRRYKEGDVPKEHIEEMVRAAGLAPSGKNIQNWHFVVIKDKAIMEKMAAAIKAKNEEMVAEMMKVDEAKALRFEKFAKNFTLFFVNAPVLTVVMSKVYTPSGYNEYKLIGADDETLKDLLHHRNPGMQSLGAAIENFYLRAVDLGYGLCWLTSANYAAAALEKILKEDCGFEKEGYFLAALLSIGVPEDNQKSPAKLPVEEILTYV
ncbi:Nitroreductase [Peptostreptococcaceae bacterium pGA-8]|nr:Nitroreductase [Peptostreptococcaceae bacterium pGA-8]